MSAMFFITWVQFDLLISRELFKADLSEGFGSSKKVMEHQVGGKLFGVHQYQFLTAFSNFKTTPNL